MSDIKKNVPLEQRPTVDTAMVLAALEKFGLACGMSKDALDDIAQVYSHHDDGYALAKKLDDGCGWDVDSNMVRQLDGVGGYVDEELAEAIRDWVTRNNIQPPVAVGQRVSFKRGREVVQGTVDGLADSAYFAGCYDILVDGDENHPNQRRSIIKYEDVTPL